MNVFGVVGWKNSGKTGLVVRLVTELTARGFSVSTIKHAHHSFNVDHKGRDSYRHREAGARQVLVASDERWALMSEQSGGATDVPGLLSKLDPVDLILVEGFKTAAMPKLETYRADCGQPPLAGSDRNIVAVASSDAIQDCDQPVFDPGDQAAIADFIIDHLGLHSPADHDGSADRFALPPGVNWLPVDQALAVLRQQMTPVVRSETVGLGDLTGRVLAAPVQAIRASPPRANAAVDGYGLARDTVAGDASVLPLTEGRAAPGKPWGKTLEPGHAVRVLTGATLPDGVDTIVLQENATATPGQVTIDKMPRQGANTRQAGEDLKPGQPVFATRHLMRATDCALLASAGHHHAEVFARLTVGVMSTGDELVEPGQNAGEAGIFDANRPMLIPLLQRWGFEPVDLGRVSDSETTLRDALDAGAQSLDAIVTSGGASAGDEDHFARLLDQAGGLHLWRIAVKPGRPLAVGRWRDSTMFCLPGNPVAAWVCALIFVRPALLKMAGARWSEAQGFTLPAAFSKSKKPGRREYLRARVNADSAVEIFGSEGSGRVSGLSWSDGLVELDDGAKTIRPGDAVRYLPYSSFGL